MTRNLHPQPKIEIQLCLTFKRILPHRNPNMSVQAAVIWLLP